MYYQKEDVLLRDVGDGALERYSPQQGWVPYQRPLQDIDPTTIAEIDEAEASEMMAANEGPTQPAE